jgi:hypothetical protein
VAIHGPTFWHFSLVSSSGVIWSRITWLLIFPWEHQKAVSTLNLGKSALAEHACVTPNTWRGALKREALGKRNFEWVKGWVNEKNLTRWLGDKNVLSFPTHGSIKYWRLKSNVNSHMWIQYVQFVRRQMVSPNKVHVHTTWNINYTAENCTSSYQTHVTEVVKDMCENWKVIVFGQGGYLFFNWYLRLAKKCWLSNGWISKGFAKKTFLLGATLRRK